MPVRIIVFLLMCILTASCAVDDRKVVTNEKEQETLFILPDGTMMFNGRIINKEDVVIYDAAQRGERAAVRLIIPLHPDAYRDTITVERKEIDVAVERK
jgi:hypothetical protein